MALTNKGSMISKLMQVSSQLDRKQSKCRMEYATL